jgi:phosphoenolpyruvate carboxykinase (ATP)
MAQHEADCWLVNTGWSGGPYGVGNRMKIAWTRRLIEAALTGELKKAKWVKDERFGFEIPTQVEGVPDDILSPRKVWAKPEAFDLKANELATRFVENFQQFANEVDEKIRAAGPRSLP